MKRALASLFLLLLPAVARADTWFSGDYGVSDGFGLFINWFMVGWFYFRRQIMRW
jgi:hypothetical protein